LAEKDRYKYFRIEAREILEGLAKGVLQLEKSGADKEVVGRLFRYAHTLKGAARVVKQTALADAAHAVEDVLSPYRENGAAVPQAKIDELLRIVDAMTGDLAKLGGGEGSAPQGSHGPAGPPDSRPEANGQAPAAVAVRPAATGAVVVPGDESLETVRVEVEAVDRLLEEVFQAIAQVNGIARSEAAIALTQQSLAALAEQLGAARTARAPAAAIERARALSEGLAQDLGEALERLAQSRAHAENAVRAIHDRARRLRLVAASTIFGGLERAVRDAALTRGVKVEFHATGGDTVLDGHVLLAVRDALSHVVRNAVTHGIESEAERTRGGKPPVGSIRLQVEQRGHQVVFVCHDDGQGIDVQAVRGVALARGLLNETEATTLSAEVAMQLVFLPGVSTSKSVTELAGRGVGLDVVRDTARRFKGDAEIRSELGRATSVEIRVPVSLSSLAALLVEVDGAVHALPLDAATAALRVPGEDVLRTGDRETIVVSEEAIPFVPLGRLLGSAKTGDVRGSWSAVVLRAGGRRAAVGVDRILGTSETIVKPLPRLSGAAPLVMGASFDADGDPQLMLDGNALVEAACSARGPVQTVQASARSPILVIDDSLTTRMLEQSILESAGYEVDVASSAEEALTKARSRRYGLFVCDVEMPGMDGYGFVTTTRANAELRETPVIMVTSLSTPENRQRGLDAGASDYIVKGEFDQARLLDRIRSLIG
jgi:two-component system chemotaxis sensor kinase CheA